MDDKVQRHPPALVAELDASELAASLEFYAALGFNIDYERPNEGFVHLVCGGTHLMLQRAEGPGRRFRTAELQRPYGRGINFQLEVPDVAAVHEAVLGSGGTPLIDLEERWYVTGATAQGNRQFVVADPDGYLWRPFEDLGIRPA